MGGVGLGVQQCDWHTHVPMCTSPTCHTVLSSCGRVVFLRSKACTGVLFTVVGSDAVFVVGAVVQWQHCVWS